MPSSPLGNGTGRYLYAVNTTSAPYGPKTGDAANITGSYTLDSVDHSGFNTAHPTEIGGGVYWQPMTSGELTGYVRAYRWSSVTSGVVIQPIFELALPTLDTSGDVTFNNSTIGSVTGSVGSISGITFPTNFSLLTINNDGSVVAEDAAPIQRVWAFFMKTTGGALAPDLSVTLTKIVDGATPVPADHSPSPIGTGTGFYVVTLSVNDQTFQNEVEFIAAATGCQDTTWKLANT